jgi:hypothetical protein
LLVGTLGGKFEIWNIDPNQQQPTIKQVFDAHPGSQQGVSQIMRLVDPSPMIIGDKGGENCQFLVSTAADKPEILIWRLQVTPNATQVINMKVHIQIKTSFTDGIKFIVQTAPT